MNPEGAQACPGAIAALVESLIRIGAQCSPPWKDRSDSRAEPRHAKKQLQIQERRDEKAEI
jgi:hypothetical protein